MGSKKISGNGKGISPYTSRKQEDFHDVFNVIVNMSKSPMYRFGSDFCFYYFDLNSASGSEDGCDGSPLIALKLAYDAGLPLRAWFFEEDATKVSQLDNRIRGFLRDHTDFSCEFFIISGDHRETAPPIIDSFVGRDPELYGLIYADPYGVPCYDVLRRFSVNPRFYRTDILIHTHATSHKRVSYSPCHDENRKLNEFISLINKKKKFIREYYTAGQFTMVFCTNWREFPPRALSGNGFHDVESEIGRRILWELTLNREEFKVSFGERHERVEQGRLFW